MTTATPPLARRVVLLSVATVALVLLTVNLGVYLALRASLLHTLDDVLAERATTVRVEQQRVPVGDGAELARQLQARGLRASVRTADGQVFRSDPSSPVLSGTLPPATGDDGYAARAVDLPGGVTARVFARTSGVWRTLHQLLALQVLGSLVALALAAVLLTKSARVALRPVGLIAEAVSGRRGERMRPDRPDTELGQLATAHNDMLDALEEGERRTADLERRSALDPRWRQVVEAANEAYLAVDASGLIHDWNRRAEALLGWTREQVVGRPAALIVAGGGDQEGITQWISSTLDGGADGIDAPYELRLLTREQRTFDAECTVWGVDRRGDRLLHVFLRDISRRHEGQQIAARLAAVVEGSSDAILTQDLDGTIRTWNAAAQRSYGWSAEEAIGESMALLVEAAELALLTDKLTALGKGERVAAYEGERRTRGGTTVPVSVRLSPLYDAAGAVVAASSIERDLTEERFLAGTLDATLAALEDALGEATAAEVRTRQFLADAAHQLRTPMAGISSCAETLLRGVPHETAEHLLALMVRETAHAARLITALLAVARLDQGEPLVLVPCDAAALCAEEIERAQLLSPQLDITLQTPAAAVPALLDPSALSEILGNLIDNARRHARARIQVAVTASSEEVRIAVRDDGPGVPADRADQIFERFVTLDAAGGSGLGLPIARGYARAMGGDLVYADGFVLRLPAPPD